MRSKPHTSNQRSKPYPSKQRTDGGRNTGNFPPRNPAQTQSDQTPEPDPTAKPQTNQTPIMAKGVAGMAHAAEKEVHSVVDHLVIGEIKDAIVTDLKGLDGMKLPDKAIGFCPEAVMERIRKRRGPNKLYENDTWANFPTASTPDAEQMLMDIFNEVGAAVEKIGNLYNGPRRQWSSEFSGKAVRHNRCARQPDLVLMNTQYVNTNADWSRIFVVTELKIGTTVTRKDVLMQLAQTARLVFGAQPDRRFVLGVAVCNSEMTLTVFNRAGLLTSDWFDVHQSPARFIRIVAGLMFADREHLGFDSTMDLTDVDGPSKRTVTVNKKVYEVKEVIHVENVIRGRATVCLKVSREDNIYVVKNAWVDKSRKMKEPEIMKIVEGVEGLPDLVDHECLTIEETKLDGSKTAETEAKSGSTEVDEKEKIADSTKVDVDKLDAQGLTPSQKAKIARLDNREQVRVVLSPFGSPVEDFGSLRELIHAIIGVVEAIEGMHKKDVLHRDISLYNILLSNRANENGERHGLLIDLDYAIHLLSKRVAAACHRTGTYPFMAIEILDTLMEVEHRYDHDLESVFYVLCYICCTSAGPNGLRRENFDLETSSLGGWFGKEKQDMKDTANAKRGTIASRVSFSHIIKCFDPYFQDEALKKCMNDLRELLFTVPLEGADREMRDPNGNLAIKFIARDEREPSDFFAEYRRILRKAYTDVVERRPNMSTAHTPSGTNISALGRAEDMLPWREIDIPDQQAIDIGLEGGDVPPAPEPATVNPIMDSGVDFGSVSTIGIKRKPSEKERIVTPQVHDDKVSHPTKRPRMEESTPAQQPSPRDTQMDNPMDGEPVVGPSPAQQLEPPPIDIQKADSTVKAVAASSRIISLRTRRVRVNSQPSGSKDVGRQTQSKEAKLRKAKSLSAARDAARVVYLTRSKAKEIEQEAAR